MAREVARAPGGVVRGRAGWSRSPMPAAARPGGVVRGRPAGNASGSGAAARGRPSRAARTFQIHTTTSRGKAGRSRSLKGGLRGGRFGARAWSRASSACASEPRLRSNRSPGHILWFGPGGALAQCRSGVNPARIGPSRRQAYGQRPAGDLLHMHPATVIEPRAIRGAHLAGRQRSITLSHGGNQAPDRAPSRPARGSSRPTHGWEVERRPGARGAVASVRTGTAGRGRRRRGGRRGASTSGRGPRRSSSLRPGPGGARTCRGRRAAAPA